VEEQAFSLPRRAVGRAGGPGLGWQPKWASALVLRGYTIYPSGTSWFVFLAAWSLPLGAVFESLQAFEKAERLVSKRKYPQLGARRKLRYNQNPIVN